MEGRRSLQAFDVIGQQLIDNYTAYINEEESIEEIEEFTNSINVAVEEAGLTTPVGEEELTRQPTQSPTFLPTPSPTNAIIKSQFQQTYYGPITAEMNQMQLNEYENYFESLTPEYADESIRSSCRVTLQELEDESGSSDELNSLQVTYDIKLV